MSRWWAVALLLASAGYVAKVAWELRGALGL